MIDAEQLEKAAQKHDVPLTPDQARKLAELIRETETAYAHHIADESLDDLLGAGGAGRLEVAAIASRRVLQDCVAIVNADVLPPPTIGAADPMIDAAQEHIESPTEGGADYVYRVAAAARRVADRVRTALEGADASDIELLKNVVMAKREAHRPATGIELPRRFIRAVYYFWFHEGGNCTMSLGNYSRGTPPSALVRLAVATCEAAGFEVQLETIRAVVNRYRRDRLRIKSAAAGMFEEIKPERSHFQDEKLVFLDWLDQKPLSKGPFRWWLAPTSRPRSK